MKKIVTVILALMVLISSGLAAYGEENDEILFRDIPWGSNPSEVKELLAKENISTTAIASRFPILSFGEELRFYDEFDMVSCDQGCFEGLVLDANGTTVGGHEISSIAFDFIYGVDGETVSFEEDDSRLVKASYTLEPVDKFEVYEDLVNKLTSLYGEPEKLHRSDEEVWGTDDIIHIVEGSLWTGANNTAVLLSMEWYTEDGTTEKKMDVYEEDMVYLRYGKTDTADTINFLNEYWAQKAMDESEGNMEGL